VGREAVLTAACFASGLAFGLIGHFLVFLGVVYPSGVYWHHLFKATLLGWQWSVIAALTFIPLIPSAYFTEGKKTEVLYIFAVSSVIGLMVYFGTYGLHVCSYILLLILGVVVYVKATYFPAKKEEKVEG